MANMYRVGDYVYFESSPTSPFHIRRIEELNKTVNGSVEAKVMCFYRRRDLPTSLIALADKHQQGATEGDLTNGVVGISGWGANSYEELNQRQRHQLKQRELFLSRRVETMPSTLIKGKCSVTLLNETESLLSYLNTEDMFFYCLVFDPTQKTLLADKGEIRVGAKYQAEITPMLLNDELATHYEGKGPFETVLWTPYHGLTDTQIDQYLVLSRSVGTFARALDGTSSIRQPSLHMSAAAASRDITLFYAMDVLHKHNYDMSTVYTSLVPETGPVMCRDEMEDWSATEANLFEEALEKYGKDFGDIRTDYLPWKSLKAIVEYYYMWKTTDRYVQQKRVKAVEAESKLKQVYVPNYANKPEPQTAHCQASVNGSMNGSINGSMNVRDLSMPTVNICEVCSCTSSSQWYPWTLSSSQSSVCQNCWNYWKKYGGFKVPSKLAEVEVDVKPKTESIASEEDKASTSQGSEKRHRCNIIGCGKEFKMKAHLARHYATSHGIAVQSNSPRPIMKTKAAFFLHTSLVTKVIRRLCQQEIPPRHLARAPFLSVNFPKLKQQYLSHLYLADRPGSEMRAMLRQKQRDRGSVTNVATYLLRSRKCEMIVPEWLAPVKDRAKSEVIAFPKPPKGPDGSLLYDKIPNSANYDRMFTMGNLKRRTFDEINGVVIPQVGPPSKRSHKTDAQQQPVAPIPMAPPPTIPHQPPALPPMQLPLPLPLYSPLLPPMAIPDVMAPIQQQAQPAALPIPLDVAQQHVRAQPNGARNRVGMMPRVGRKQLMPWNEAPDDLYFRATPNIKRIRRSLTMSQLRKASRRPWKKFDFTTRTI